MEQVDAFWYAGGPIAPSMEQVLAFWSAGGPIAPSDVSMVLSSQAPSAQVLRRLISPRALSPLGTCTCQIQSTPSK